jgi:hypothetical protein
MTPLPPAIRYLPIIPIDLCRYKPIKKPHILRVRPLRMPLFNPDQPRLAAQQLRSCHSFRAAFDALTKPEVTKR